MKLPKKYFENLSISKYREYIKLLPSMKKESTKAITMLIFTFIALSFLGLFAINPTLATIIELHKKLTESEFVHEQLTTKMNNLSSLQQQYNSLTEDLTFVSDAIPQNANVPTAIGQIEQLARQSNITITSLSIASVTLSDPKHPQDVKKDSSFIFSLKAEGTYQDMLTFAKALTNFDRIVTIESLSFIKDEQNSKLILGIEGREYFKK